VDEALDNPTSKTTLNRLAKVIVDEIETNGLSRTNIAKVLAGYV
jgi:hypothetical protein